MTPGEAKGLLNARVILGVTGALGGLAVWAVNHPLTEILTQPQSYLFVSAFLFGYFFAALALIGPLGALRAALFAAVVALPPAALLTWASLRHDTLAGFFARLDPLIAGVLILCLPLPFLVAAQKPGAGWRHYPTLFAESWGIIVRLASGLLFAGVVWMTIFLANELLRLVSIDIISQIIAFKIVPPVVTGIAVGLALAIIAEVEGLVTPAIMLRLLRVMVVPAFLIVGLFAFAVPLQGYGALFGVLSPAGTLLIITFLIAILVSAAADATDGEAVTGLSTRLAARGLALLLPVLAALAFEAVRLRIAEHGLSPGRMASSLAALVLFCYGVLYTLSALTGVRWMARIREVNTWMALMVFGIAVLWLTPLLNAERMSAANQLARLADGRLTAETVDLWALRHEWGKPGRAALVRLSEVAAAPGETRLRERLALVNVAPDRSTFGRPIADGVTQGSRAALKALMPVQPPEAIAEFDRFVLPWYAGSVGGFLEGCNDRTASGRPGCVLVVADLLPDNPGNEGILFYKAFGLLRGEVIVPEPIFRRADASDVFSIPAPDFAESDAILEQLQDGKFTAGPARINAITIGPRQFTIPF